MQYNHFIHRHNFAVWAGARAAQRGFTNVKILRDALEQCGIVDFLKDPSSLNITKEEYRELHTQWCHSIIDYLTESGVSQSTFGRAAKLIAVYLKSMIIITNDTTSSLSIVAYPPIDRILLQNIAGSPEIICSQKYKWKTISWTKLNEKEYYSLIDELFLVLPNGLPFWHIEKYWDPSSD